MSREMVRNRLEINTVSQSPHGRRLVVNESAENRTVEGNGWRGYASSFRALKEGLELNENCRKIFSPCIERLFGWQYQKTVRVIVGVPLKASVLGLPSKKSFILLEMATAAWNGSIGSTPSVFAEKKGFKSSTERVLLKSPWNIILSEGVSFRSSSGSSIGLNFNFSYDTDL